MFSKDTDPDFLIIILVSIGIILLFITTVFSLIYLTKRRFLRHQFEKQELKQSFEKEKLKAEIEIQEQVFSFLSGELHDNIGQSLSLVKLNLNMGSPSQIEQAKNILTTSIQELRNLAQNLNSDSLKNTSLLTLINNEVNKLKHTLAYHVNLISTDNLEDIVFPNQIILFRIFQEALNNIIKHSQAKHIEVDLQLVHQRFTLSLKDDGVGFDTGLEETQVGLGLVNMKKRAILIGADIQIKSSHQNGCSIILSVDLNKAALHDDATNYNHSFS